MTRGVAWVALVFLLLLILSGCSPEVAPTGTPTMESLVGQAAASYGGPVRLIYGDDQFGMGGWELRYAIVESADSQRVSFVEYYGDGAIEPLGYTNTLERARRRRTFTAAYGPQCEAITGGAVVLSPPWVLPQDKSICMVGVSIAVDSKLGDAELEATSARVAAYLLSQQEAILQGTGATQLNVGLTGVSVDDPRQEGPYLTGWTEPVVRRDSLLRGRPSKTFYGDYGLGDTILPGTTKLAAPGWYMPFTLNEYLLQKGPSYGDWQPLP